MSGPLGYNVLKTKVTLMGIGSFFTYHFCILSIQRCRMTWKPFTKLICLNGFATSAFFYYGLLATRVGAAIEQGSGSFAFI